MVMCGLYLCGFFEGGGEVGLQQKDSFQISKLKLFLVAQTYDFLIFLQVPHFSYLCKEWLNLSSYFIIFSLFYSFFTAFQAQKREQILKFVKNTPHNIKFFRLFSRIC